MTLKAKVVYIEKGTEQQECEHCGKVSPTGTYWVGLQYEGEEQVLEGCYGAACVRKFFKVGSVIDMEKIWKQETRNRKGR